VFVALLATPLVLKRLGAWREVTSKVDATEALSRYGFHLQEVAQASGISFVHQAPTLDHRLDHIMPQVAAMGAGASVVDFDRDGWQDIYLTNSGEGSKNCLYRNLGNGSFQDVAGELGLADVNQQGTGVSMGAVWGDYDNDGFEDVFLYKWGRPELFHNDGGKAFTRVTETAGLPAWADINAALARRRAGVAEQQRRGVARLRPRRQARSVPRRLLRRAGEPLASRQHEDDAG